MSLFPRFTQEFSPLFPRFTQEFSPLFRLLDDYERAAFRPFPDSNLRTFSPKFDIKELKDSYELHGEFPGVEQKDITIEWTDANTLTINGRHEEVREEGTRPAALVQDGEPSLKEAKHKESTEVAKTSDKEVAKSENEPKCWVSERSIGTFHRSFSFPDPVDQEHVKASLKNGILRVIVPKAKKATPRVVTIE